MESFVEDDAEETARSFGTAGRRLLLVTILICLTWPLLLWGSGVAALAWQATTIYLPAWLATILYLAFVLHSLAVVLLPSSHAESLALPRRYALSHQTTRSWFRDWATASALADVLGTAVGFAFYSAVEGFGALWWALFGAVLLLGTVALTFVLPYLVLPLFFRVKPMDDPDLIERVHNLFRAAHASLAAVVTLDFSRRTRRANAAVVGLGKSRRVVLSDTLLASFSAKEIECIVAHELGHHVLGHIAKQILVEVATLTVGLAVAVFVVLPALRLPTVALADRTLFPLLLVAVQLWSLAVLPLGNGFSRRLEREADRFACRLTGEPRAFISALRQLARLNLVEMSPPRWAVLLLSSHPPIAERIRLAAGATGN